MMVLLQASKIMDTNSSTILPHASTSFNPLLNSLYQLLSFLQTLYLFTKNDIATFLFPTTLFAILATLSGPLLTTDPSPSLLSTISRTPLTLFITWSNLVIFDISNQRSPSAVAEDIINKPHRPLPSGRITECATRRLLLGGIPIVLGLSWIVGCWQETLLLFSMTWMYNDLQGCDEDWVLRNFLIALGYGCYSSAALKVMIDDEHTISPKGYQWIAFITVVMFVTQHICDIKDAEGDRVRGRKSAPIVLGDEIVRWTVAVPILFCSLIAPAFFGLGFWSFVSTLAAGCLVAGRTLMCRDLEADKRTWKLWALWTCWIFALPLVKNPNALASAWEVAIELFCPGGDCSGSLNLVAVGSIAVAVKGKRLYDLGGREMFQRNTTTAVPRIVVEGVIL